jgi:hypothetical protein
MATDALLAQGSPYPKVRRWPRYKLNVPLRVIADLATKTAIVQGRGTELNGGGLAVFAGIELAVDAQVGVEFTPPYSGEPIRTRCVVRDRNGYIYGLEFIAESDEDFDKVEQIRSALQGMGSPLR